MAFTPYHSITYNSGLYHNGVASGVNIELIVPGDNVRDIKSILITNTHATADATVSLYIQNDPTGGTTSTFYMLSTVAIPSDTSLLLEGGNVIKFNNSSSGFGLYVTVGSTDTIDLIINK